MLYMSQFSPLIDPAGSRWDTVHTQRGTTSRLAQETEPNVCLLQCTSLKLATLYAVASFLARLFSKKNWPGTEASYAAAYKCLFDPYRQIRFEAAVETFMLSCAGYCVATYVLVGVVVYMFTCS